MKDLSKITLICVDCYYYGSAFAAIQKSLKQICPARAVFLTDINIPTSGGIEVVQIPTIRSKKEYSHFIIKELYKYFDTEFALVIQHDGYVLNGDVWNDEFYNYDYIGAPFLYIDGRNIGNGGFSLRSAKLQQALGTDPFIEITHPEDEIIARLYRNYLEDKYDVKFPSEELADTFSFELRTPTAKTFGFHGHFHEQYKPTVVVRRDAALGDVVAVEPVLEYFHSKGYRVVLDTLPQFHLLFLNHYFRVHKKEEVDGRLLENAKYVNLNMAYETRPEQLHLKSYFEFAGVSDYKLRNPKLYLGFDLNHGTKLFKKYAVIHIDKRPQGGRNIEGVNWELVCGHLKTKGYTVIQVGRGEHEEPYGATYINCTNENFLSYVCGGADLFVGIDSGIANICVAFGVPAVIGFGSVNPEYIYPDLSKIAVVHNHDKNPCSKKYCWSSEITTVGVECYIDEKKPPCARFETEQFIYAIDKLTR